MNKPINVTKAFLPPIKEYTKYLKGIWKRGYITNNGPLLIELENKLKKKFGVKHLFFVTNGTLALQIAIKALDLKNEVITTPFSYVATTSSLVWENCKPVFADIDADTLTINPKEIERKITKKTTGIVATHVFGNPCNVEEIQKIAKKHKLKVLYDAAHAFGVKHKEKSILNYGDISILSFHATKLFHTIEGGAIITNDDKLAKKVGYLRNFGHVSISFPEKFSLAGINGKASEFQAAMGLCLLPKIDMLIASKKMVSKTYDKFLDFNIFKKPYVLQTTQYNYSYYPLIFPSETILLKTIAELNKNNIFPRRYFYPSLNNLHYVEKQKCDISEKISSRILCLPLYYNLSEKNIKLICHIIKNSYENKKNF